MKKIFTSVLVLIVWATSLSAITREEADVIVQNYVQSEAAGTLYANLSAPNGEGITVATSNEETFKAKYACWTYCLDESESSLRRYLFVKEEGGSLLEVIASNDQSVLDNDSWVAMDVPTGLTNSKGSIKLLYPNPVGDLLTLSCNGENTHVEIYDLKGTRLFSGLLSGKDNCQLNVSFLNTGVYMVTVSGETYKIIKK
jgi:hypothetical protein